MVSKGLSIFSDCINSIFFGQVCDTCDGAAIYSLLAAIIRIFTIGIGILAVIGIMIAGIHYLKSSGDPAKKNKARSRLINIAIGIIIYVVLFAFGEFLMPGGIIAHPIASTDETASCPEISYTDVHIRRTGGGGGGEDPAQRIDGYSPYAGTAPDFTRQTATYNGTEYNYIEIKNATPYIYVPKNQQSFTDDLKSIENKEDGENILIISNAGTFSLQTNEMLGIIIQNKTKISDLPISKPWNVFLVDEEGDVGFLAETATADDMINGNASYINGLTGETVKGRKIVSATYQFGPIVINGQKVNLDDYRAASHYADHRERQIYCLKSDKTNVMITNKKNLKEGGWDFNEMTDVAIERGCQFAFNFDGGGSTATAWRNTTSESFGNNIYRSDDRNVPSFIVFTSNNLPPGMTMADFPPAGTDLTPTEDFDPKSELLNDNGLQYWLNVPEGATDKMPLVIFLHGDGEKNNAEKVKDWKAVKEMWARKDFISIAPVLTESDWTNVADNLKKAIDKTVSTYKINQQKIYIFGFSRGGMGTWAMVDKYPSLFAAAVPISGNISITPANFKNTPIRAMAGSKESGYIERMQAMVKSINDAGGEATLKTVEGKAHGDMQYGLDYKSIFDWMLEKTNSKAPAPKGSPTGAEIAEQPQIEPKCTVTKKAISDTLRIRVCEEDNLYFSYVWVKNANQQFKKEYPTKGSENTTERAKRLVEKGKIAIAFNLSEPVYKKDGYCVEWANADSFYELKEPSPIIIKNGTVVLNTPEKFIDERENHYHFLAWIDKTNQLRYSKRWDKYGSKDKRNEMYTDVIKNSGTNNTMVARAVFYANGQKTNLDDWSIAGGGANRTGSVTLCQLNTNNFIVVTNPDTDNTATNYTNLQNKLMKLGCKTAISGDGGSSTFTHLIRKDGTVITFDSTTRPGAMFYFSEL